LGVRLHAKPFGRPPEERLVVPVTAGIETDVPADRTHVPQLRSAHELRGLRERGVTIADALVACDFGEGGPSGYLELAVLVDACRVAEARERDEHLGRELAALHAGEEIGATGDEKRAKGARPASAVDCRGTGIDQQTY